MPSSRKFHIAALIFVPIFAVLFSQLRIGPAQIDPWFYYGYGTDFGLLLKRFGWTYYAARIPWIFILHIYFSIFDPHVALILCGLTISVLGAISLYSILTRYYSTEAAFLTSFVFVANPWYLADSFWLYVDGPTIAASLFTIATFLHGLRRNSKIAFLISGLTAAVGVNVHVIFVVLVFPCLICMLLAEQRRWTPQLLISIVTFAAAAAAALLVMCVATWWAFGKFWFFAPSIATAESVVTGAWHSWVHPLSVWLPRAPASFMPPGLLLAGAIVFAREIMRRDTHRDIWIFSYAIFIALCILVSDGLLNAGRLEHSYYLIYLWVPAFLLLGRIISSLLENINLLLPYAVGGVIVIDLCTLLYGGKLSLLHVGIPSPAMWGIYSTIAVTFAALAAVLAGFGRAREWPNLIGLYAAFVFVSVTTASDARDRVWWREPLGWQDFETTAEAMEEGRRFTGDNWLRDSSRWPDFETTVAMQHFINDNLDVNRRLLFWYDGQAPGGNEFLAVNSAFLFGYSRFNGTMPNLADEDIKKLSAPASLVLLMTTEADGEGAITVLRERGLVEDIVAKTTAGRGPNRIQAWIVNTRPVADADPRISNDDGSAPSRRESRVTFPLAVTWDHLWLSPEINRPPAGRWPLTIRTPAKAWNYGAVLPYQTDFVRNGASLRLHITMRVVEGKAGIGIVNRGEKDFIQREFFSASSRPITVTLFAPDSSEIGSLVVETADESESALVIIDAIDVVADLRRMPLILAGWTDSTTNKTSAKPLGPFPIEVQTPPGPWRYDGTIAYRLAENPPDARVMLQLKAHIREGEAAFSLLDSGGTQLPGQVVVSPSEGFTTITLISNTSSLSGELIIQSGASGVPARVEIESIDAWSLP